MNTLTPADQQLFDAVRNEKISAVHDAVKAGANVNAMDRFGFSPLLVAAAKGNPEVVSCLASLGANMRHVSRADNMFPIAFAAVFGGLPALRNLAAHCADFESPLPGQKGALEHAIEAGQIEVVDYLLNHGADLESVNELGETLLMRVCAARKIPIAIKLIEHGAKCTSTDNYGNTVLGYSLATRNLALIKKVAAAVDDDEVRLHLHMLRPQPTSQSDETHVDDTPPLTIDTRTALRVQAWLRWRHLKRATVLAWHKVSGGLPRLKRQERIDAAFVLALETADVRTSLYLIEQGANPNGANAHGVPVLILAAQAFAIHCARYPDIPAPKIPQGVDFATIVLRLMMRGANPHARDPRSGRTVLHEACANDHVVLAVTLLHERMIPHLVNVSDFDLNRPIHHAVSSRSYTTIEALAKSGADMNAVNRHGLAPLHVAALHVDPDSGSLLVARGANAFLPTRSGRTLTACLDTKHPSYGTFVALIEARRAINNAMTIFSGRNPLAAAARQMSRIPPKRNRSDN